MTTEKERNMKYPCGMIRDLLPLYHDSVCSQESRLAVEEHLEECGECEAAYKDLLSADRLEPEAGRRDPQAESFRRIKSRVNRRAALIGAATFLLISGLLAAAFMLMRAARIKAPEDLITQVYTGYVGPYGDGLTGSNKVLRMKEDFAKYPRIYSGGLKNEAEGIWTQIAASVEIDGETEYVLALGLDLSLWDYATADPDPWKGPDQAAKAMEAEALSDQILTTGSWEEFRYGGYYGDLPSQEVRESGEFFLTRVYFFRDIKDFNAFMELVSTNDPAVGRIYDEDKLNLLEKAELVWED